MEELTIQFPKELKSQIDLHPEIDWSLIFKKTASKFLNKLALAEFLESKLEQSEFTEQDALELGELAKQHRLKELKSQNII